ncbi:DUF2236 domain-containing protein, partial [Nocardioides sp. GCM10030258]
MSAAADVTPQGSLPGTTPTRFMAGVERNRRLGRPLKLVGRVKGVDEDLLARIGEAMMERDEPG